MEAATARYLSLHFSPKTNSTPSPPRQLFASAQRSPNDKSIFSGTVENGERKVGELSTQNGKYHGTWSVDNNNNSSFSGRVSNLNLSNGNTYNGKFSNSQPNGKGTMTKPDGSMLDTIWCNGKMTYDTTVIKKDKAGVTIEHGEWILVKHPPENPEKFVRANSTSKDWQTSTQFISYQDKRASTLIKTKYLLF